MQSGGVLVGWKRVWEEEGNRARYYCGCRAALVGEKGSEDVCNVGGCRDSQQRAVQRQKEG